MRSNSSKGNSPAAQEADGLVQAFERAGLIRNRDHFNAPIHGMITIGRVHAQDQFGSRGDSQGNFFWCCAFLPPRRGRNRKAQGSALGI